MNATKLDKAFIQGFLKNWQGLNTSEELALAHRKQELDRVFAFTSENIKQLRQINDLLLVHEERVRHNASRIFAMEDNWLSEKVIDNYEADVVLQCFNDKYYSELHEDFDGEPFYQNMLTINCKKAPELFYAGNWNEFFLELSHPLQNDVHCYSFRHLYFDSPLAWQDILRIEKVCANIVMQNHFVVSVRANEIVHEGDN